MIVTATLEMDIYGCHPSVPNSAAQDTLHGSQTQARESQQVHLDNISAGVVTGTFPHDMRADTCISIDAMDPRRQDAASPASQGSVHSSEDPGMVDSAGSEAGDSSAESIESTGCALALVFLL